MLSDHSVRTVPTSPTNTLDQAAVSRLVSSVLHESSGAAFAGMSNRAPRLGVNVVDIEILARQLTSRIGDVFTHRIFTEDEITDCRNQAAKFATRWAIKEAVSKAIGTGFREGFRPKAIEVLTAGNGAIQIAPTLGQVWPHNADQWKWVVSAAHESNVAVAVAVALS